MTSLILDTHAAINELVSAGMPERQAETVVRQQAKLLEQNLATKADIEAAKVDLIKWIFGVNLGTASLIVALIKLL